MKFMEWDTINDLEKLEYIWNSIPGNIPITEMEKRFRDIAVHNGISAVNVERFLIIGDI